MFKFNPDSNYHMPSNFGLRPQGTLTFWVSPFRKMEVARLSLDALHSYIEGEDLGVKTGF